MMVLGVVCYFGIKQGMGSERLSEFFQAVRLEQQE
jgi:predicted PolB exonuclease-like 3'-5' exonuclease